MKKKYCKHDWASPPGFTFGVYQCQKPGCGKMKDKFSKYPFAYFPENKGK